MNNKLILIAGPTASGKSKLSIDIAKKINGEIINADSMQVYREFSILSSRPSKKDLQKINHHLYGFISVKSYFSTGEWLKLVKAKINKCVKDFKTPILVGGTGLYFNAITKGISKIPEIKQNERNEIRNLHKKLGQNNFYKKLILLDPLSKTKFSSSDTQRALRAYEVKYFTKKSLYEWTTNTNSDFLNYNIKKIFLDMPREELLKNIKKRVEAMFDMKCIDEVKKFKKIRLDSSLSANKLIGVKEITKYLDGSINLAQTKELINIKTRQYAKSQNTWSRGYMSNWNRVYSKDFSKLSKKVLKLLS